MSGELDAMGGSLAYFEWSCPEGTDLDDRDACRAANPSLAAGAEDRPWALNEEWIYEVERPLLSGDGEFARERFGIFPDDDDAPQWLVISEADYLAADAGVPDGAEGWLVGPVSLAVELSDDRRTVTVAAVGVDADGVAGGQVVLREPNGPDVLDIVAGLATDGTRPVSAVVVDARSHAGSLVPDLEALGVSVTECPAKGLVQATGSILDAVRGGGFKFRHSDDLDAAVAQAETRKYGDAELIDRWSGGDPTPFIAVVLARWGATQAPVAAPEPDFIVI